MKYTAQMLHQIVKERFIREPYGHLLDYAPKVGSNIYPTSEMCENNFPNPLGWWTPSENGAFFTGLYLASLTEKYSVTKSDEIKEEILHLLSGLFILQDIGKTDGFIARGVSDDGKSCYVCSSEDQVCPWVLGLWKAYCCDAVDENQKSEIKERILKLSMGLENHNFNIPTLWKEHTWGGFLGGDYRSCAKLLGLLRITYEVTRDNKWLDLYEKYGNEVISSPFTRFDVCFNGCASDMVKNIGLIQFWIHACSQLFIRELATLDKSRSNFFNHSLNATAIIAVKFLDEYKTYLSVRGKEFDIDWTKLSSLYRQCTDPLDGMNIALEENKFWMSKIVPERHNEHNILGNCLFGALICSAAPDEKIQRHVSMKTDEILKSVDFAELNLSYAFVAESVLYYLKKW